MRKKIDLDNECQKHKSKDSDTPWSEAQHLSALESQPLVVKIENIQNISHSKKNSAKYDQKGILVFMSIACYSCQIVIKLDLSWQIFKKILKY
jgi:hypothetical protein